MSVNYANINLQGLNTNASRLIIDENNLIDCNNVVVDQTGIIGTRRGQEFFGNALTSISKIFGALSKVFAQADDTLYYESGGTFTEVTFPDTASFNPLAGTLVNTDSQNKSLFFNGERISDDTGSPVDRKIKKLTSPSASVVNAGLEAPINVSVEVDTTGTGFSANDSVRLRVFYQYTDANGYLITSPVSKSVVAFNDTASPCGFNLKFQIPPQLNGNRVNIYYAISNTVNNFTPDDNLFWGEDTIIAINTPINVLLGSVKSTNNIIPRESIVNAVDLYTNASQEGILQNNEPPISAKDIETYSGYTFYSNLEGKKQSYFQITEFPLNTTILTYEGVSYRRSATSDYSASPVQFSGANVLEYSYDFARAFTATQPKYNAVINQNSLGGFGFDTGWVDTVVPNLSTTAWTSSCADESGNIYYVQDLTSSRLSVYNISGQVTTQLTLIPSGARGCSIIYVPQTNRIYTIGGYIPGAPNTQAPINIYDLNTRTWSVGASMPAAPGGAPIAYGAAVFVPNVRIYYFFGQNIGIGSNQNYYYEYNIGTNSFTAGGTIPTTSSYGRVYPSATYANSRIYIFGGIIEETSAFSNSTFEFLPMSNTFTAKANMTIPKARHGVAAVGNLIYVLGGATTADNYTETTEVYDIFADSFTSFTNLNNQVSAVSAVSVDSTIYMIPGIDSGLTPSEIEYYRAGGVEFSIEDKFIGDSIINNVSGGYIVRKDIPGTSSPLYQYVNEATMQFSKQGQPEAVPFLNNFFVGSASYPIKRIAALRTSLLVLKTDGIFQLNGVSPETFSLSQLDPTFVLLASQSVAKLNNEIYCLSNKGIVSINESGPKILSHKIKDLIDSALATVPQANWDTAITAAAYEDDYKYVITIGSKTFTYNYITDQWTIWHAGNSSITSWTLFNNYLYYSDVTRVLKERKTLTSLDFQDENGAGLECFIQFNNLEFMLGQVITLNAMQLQQREISGLTSEVTFINDFNTPAANEFLLSKYICRTLPPPAGRMAFWFRPKVSWDTELASPGGTFSDLKLEGIDFEYTTAQSNIK